MQLGYGPVQTLCTAQRAWCAVRPLRLAVSVRYNAIGGPLGQSAAVGRHEHRSAGEHTGARTSGLGEWPRKISLGPCTREASGGVPARPWPAPVPRLGLAGDHRPAPQRLEQTQEGLTAGNRVCGAGASVCARGQRDHKGVGREECVAQEVLWHGVTGRNKAQGQWGIGRGEVTPLPPLQGAQPMPSHCPPDAKCQLQWRL